MWISACLAGRSRDGFDGAHRGRDHHRFLLDPLLDVLLSVLQQGLDQVRFSLSLLVMAFAASRVMVVVVVFLLVFLLPFLLFFLLFLFRLLLLLLPLPSGDCCGVSSVSRLLRPSMPALCRREEWLLLPFGLSSTTQFLLAFLDRDLSPVGRSVRCLHVPPSPPSPPPVPQPSSVRSPSRCAR